MKHVIHDLLQGSQLWHAHRRAHFNASEAPALLGISPYLSRSELLHMKATGDVEEVSTAQQAIFDAGHRFEAEARPWAEEIIGTDLFPIVASIEIDGLPLSASYDGASMDEETVFEHKTASQDIKASLQRGELAEHYRAQMEQQLLIIGARRCLFMASNGTRESVLTAWYESDPAMRSRLLAAWKQFKRDLDAYQNEARIVAPVAAPVLDLPAVSVQVSGQITVLDNFKVFEVALRDFIDTRLIRKPQTDDDFANLAVQITALKKAEAALESAEVAMLSQVSSIDAMKRTKDMLFKLARDNRLMAEKLLEAEKANRREEIRAEAVLAYGQHLAALQARLGKPYIVTTGPLVADWPGVMKSLRTITSLRDAVATELARVKIASNAEADKIDSNLKVLRENEEYAFLFNDAAQLVLKPVDDFPVLVRLRISDHKAAEAKKEEETRARIQAEEREKATREAEAKSRADAQAEAERIRLSQVAQAPVAAPIPATPAPASPAPATPAVLANSEPQRNKADADMLLLTFVERYGTVKDYSTVTAAIRAHFAAGKKRKAVA